MTNYSQEKYVICVDLEKLGQSFKKYMRLAANEVSDKN